ncbi:hypothetical protein AVEN_105976-1 [Araneus ventricosus]|uniref:Uncharacterized protein n=1 Tax=Araneus ventricosus TaxID=182803 RepID=A0A4Y2DYM8_ARAVE|nr:hypothetical protein AVEN_105976-1 [Araneus ventricosus]
MLAVEDIAQLASEGAGQEVRRKIHLCDEKGLFGSQNRRGEGQKAAIIGIYLRAGQGRCGLVVRSRPRNRRVSGSKPDPTEDQPCMGPVARQIIRSGQKSSRWCGAEVWRGAASSGVVLII